MLVQRFDKLKFFTFAWKDSHPWQPLFPSTTRHKPQRPSGQKQTKWQWREHECSSVVLTIRLYLKSNSSERWKQQLTLRIQIRGTLLPVCNTIFICPRSGNTYDRCVVVDEEEASILLYDIWEQVSVLCYQCCVFPVNGVFATDEMSRPLICYLPFFPEG